jgi:hypothetical protein
LTPEFPLGDWRKIEVRGFVPLFGAEFVVVGDLPTSPACRWLGF